MTKNMQQLLDQLKIECDRLTMEDIEIYDVKGHSPLTDTVFVATATHILQLEAARKNLSKMVKDAGYPVQNPTEDYSEGWLVMDCVDLVIHILIPEKRSFYDLDGLMASIKRPYKEEDIIEDDDEFEISMLNKDEFCEMLDSLSTEELEDFLNESDIDPLKFLTEEELQKYQEIVKDNK